MNYNNFNQNNNTNFPPETGKPKITSGLMSLMAIHVKQPTINNSIEIQSDDTLMDQPIIKNQIPEKFDVEQDERNDQGGRRPNFTSNNEQFQRRPSTNNQRPNYQNNENVPIDTSALTHSSRARNIRNNEQQSFERPREVVNNKPFVPKETFAEKSYEASYPPFLQRTEEQKNNFYSTVNNKNPIEMFNPRDAPMAKQKVAKEPEPDFLENHMDDPEMVEQKNFNDRMKKYDNLVPSEPQKMPFSDESNQDGGSQTYVVEFVDQQRIRQKKDYLMNMQQIDNQSINEPRTFSILTGDNYDQRQDCLDRVPVHKTPYDGRKYTVLMVAEKPSIAQAIAQALSPDQNYNTRKGACQFTNIFEFFGEIFGRKAFFQVTSVIGHIYSTDFPVDCQDWRKIDPYKLFEVPTIKKECSPESGIVEHLQKESLGSSFLVLWLDNDREGENICFEVMNLCQPNLMKEDFQQIYRAKFSAITVEDIRKSFQNINSGPNMNESISVDARQIIDLKVGVAFTRFQTRYLVRKYEELNQQKITYGPCQTPTLNFCVERDDEIINFKTTLFYRIIPRFQLSEKEVISLDWTHQRTEDLEEAQKVKSDLDETNILQVTNVENQEYNRYQPQALNTPQLLKLSSQQAGMGPQQTMGVAEKLYLGGYITYPRSESTNYPQSFDFAGVVSALTKYQNQQIARYAQILMEIGMDAPQRGKDVGDHPPITPTNKPISQGLSRDQYNLYEIVSRVFMASISSDAKFFQQKVVFTGNGDHNFTLTGTACVTPGFMSVLPWMKIHENQIPNFQTGDIVNLAKVDLHEGRTQPPDHLTESDLISLMQKHGIGTDASMAQHISNICQREYVVVNVTTRRLVPTDLGRALIHSFKQIDGQLVAAELRSSIETSVALISEGKVNYNQVLNNVIDLFQKKYLYFVSNMNLVDPIYDKFFCSVEDSIKNAPPFSKCGRCRTQMRFLSQIAKLWCDNCQYTYALPFSQDQNADPPTFFPIKDVFCPLDGFQILLCVRTVKSNQQRISVCPLCFQQNPGIDTLNNSIKDKTTCNLCPNQLCQLSMSANEISNCKNCAVGRLVMDWPINAVGRYTMTCNICLFQYQLCKEGEVSRLNTKCAECESYNLQIQLKTFEMGYYAYQFVGCVFCDVQYQNNLLAYPPIEDDPKLKALTEHQHNKFNGNHQQKHPQYKIERGEDEREEMFGNNRGAGLKQNNTYDYQNKDIAARASKQGVNSYEKDNTYGKGNFRGRKDFRQGPAAQGQFNTSGGFGNHHTQNFNDNNQGFSRNFGNYQNQENAFPVNHIEKENLQENKAGGLRRKYTKQDVDRFEVPENDFAELKVPQVPRKYIRKPKENIPGF